MDSTRGINHFDARITPSYGTDARKAASTPAREAETTPLGDQVSVDFSSGLMGGAVGKQMGEMLGGTSAAPAVEAEKPTKSAAAQVPVSLFADGEPAPLGTASQPPVSNPIAELGLLAQLDETSAIDGAAPGKSFGGWSLVGPGSAAQFLADPQQMYLGL